MSVFAKETLQADRSYALLISLLTIAFHSIQARHGFSLLNCRASSTVLSRASSRCSFEFINTARVLGRSTAKRALDKVGD